MALAMRGFILGAPKPNSGQIPSCKPYQQKSMTKLQTQHHGLQNSRKISRSLITCDTTPIGTGKGPKHNKTTLSEQLSVSTGNSSNSEANATPKQTGKKSNGSSEANATPEQTK